jgi:hypothetical protein
MILGTRSASALRITLCLIVLSAARQAAADTITVEWDPGTEPVGYKVHVGVQPGTYTQHFDVGAATLFAYTSAAAGQRYCFTVSAYLLSSQLEGPISSEVCGYSNMPPTLVNPGARTSTVGQAVNLQLQGSDPESQPLTYSASGLPPGVSLQSSTGFISGAGTTAGTHTVTVRASDSVLTASQVFTWTMTAPAPPADTMLPTISIGSPTSNTSYSTTTASITLGGTAADNVGVVQVRWAKNGGASGIASGTTSWGTPEIGLTAGSNVITVMAVDAAGNQSTDSLTVTYSAPAPADTTMPTVSIGSPTTAASYPTTSSSLALSGTAADNVGVVQVRWAKGTNTGVATGTTSWSTPAIPLTSGSNVITITAVDAAGNQATDSLTVSYSAAGTTPPSTVTLTADTRKASKWRSTRLSWANAPWSGVDVYRNGLLITSTPNNGSYTDPIFGKGTYTYQICAPGSRTTCSNTASVFF